MPSIHRVLDPQRVDSLDGYIAAGGGDALHAARRLDGAGIAGEVNASGLRGRGGAGFPTGVKWETVAASAGTGPPPIVVVNGAEGEPGSFKDRTLLRRNPYRVLEGALIAACAVGARHVVVAVKRSFVAERRRLAYAIAEIADAGWLSGVDVRVTIGPGDYLFGEETALLEVVEGRQPFPRVAPPYRRGLTTDASAADAGTVNQSPGVGLVLANNVETLANVPGIVIRGADWFRSVGTFDSPGTIVCTVSGDTQRAGVAEFPMGTRVGEIIDEIGNGARDERRIVAAISGVANAILPVEAFDTPATYEALQAAGSGLGAAGFIVVDDSTDLVGLAAGVSRFLAVESCGQCEPCKRDGIDIASSLEALVASDPEVDGSVEEQLRDRLATITDEARCFLATQHQVVVSSLLDLAPSAVAGHADHSLEPVDPVLIAPIVDIDDGVAIVDTSQADKQPDWSFGAVDSGRWPAAYLADTPVAVSMHRHPPTAAMAASGTSSGAADSGEGADVVEATDAERRSVVIDVADQLDLVHHELVAALLVAATADDTRRQTAIDEFGALLNRHLDVTTQVLLPWVRRVGGDEGERIADQAESLEASAEHLVGMLRRDASDRTIQSLADELHRLILDEERRVLPLLEQHLGDADLDDIGRAMHEARLQRPEEATGPRPS